MPIPPLPSPDSATHNGAYVASPAIIEKNEVGIKVSLEVSNIVRELKSTSNTLTYQIGTRNASTSWWRLAPTVA